MALLMAELFFNLYESNLVKFSSAFSRLITFHFFIAQAALMDTL